MEVEAHRLTAREEKFCQEYVRCLNGTKAAIKAGYSKKNARIIASQNLTKLHIQSRIKEIQEEIKKELGIDDNKVLVELAALGYWSIKDFIEDGNTIKDLSTLPKTKLKPIIGIKTTEKTVTTEGVIETTKTTELRFADKKGALVDLGRHLGIFEKDNKQQQPDMVPVMFYLPENGRDEKKT